MTNKTARTVDSFPTSKNDRHSRFGITAFVLSLGSFGIAAFIQNTYHISSRAHESDIWHACHKYGLVLFMIGFAFGLLGERDVGKRRVFGRLAIVIIILSFF